MTTTDCANIIALVHADRLQTALRQTQVHAADLGHWELSTMLDNLSRDIEAMLSFYARGMEDPNRTSNRAQFKARLIQMVYRLRRLQEIKDGQTAYARMARSMDRQDFAALSRRIEMEQSQLTFACLTESDDSPAALDCRKRAEQADEALFNWLMVSDQWTQALYEEVEAFFDNASIGDQTKAHLCSAIILALNHTPDAYKLLLLSHLWATAESTLVSQRAICGLFLSLQVHHRAFLWGNGQPIHDTTARALDQMAAADEFDATWQSLQMALVSYRQLPKTLRRIQRDIMPRLMQGGQGLPHMADPSELRRLFEQMERGEGRSDIDVPQHFQQAIHEIQDLQRQGTDLMYLNFKAFCRTPFFVEAAHWWLPVNLDHTACRDLIGGSLPLVSPLLKSGEFCDVDIYAFCQMLGSRLSGHLDMLRQKLSELANLTGDTLLRKPELPIAKPETIRRRYLQVCYRFFTLYPYAKEWSNPFDPELPAVIRPWLPLQRVYTIDFVTQLAMTTAQNKDWSACRQVLEGEDSPTFEQLQLLGLAYSAEDSERALDCYQRALDFVPNDLWTLRHAAAILLKMGHLTEAIATYKLILRIDPDSTEANERLGFAYVTLRDYTTARHYFLANTFLLPDNPDYRRQLAWVDFCVQRLESARSALETLVTEDPRWQDYINLGHIAFVEGRISQAIAHYTQGRQMQGVPATDRFIDATDAEVLTTIYGRTAEELQLLQEAVCSHL